MRIILALLLLFFTLQSQGGNVAFDFKTVVHGSPYNAELRLQPTNAPSIISGSLVIKNSYSARTDTNGQCTVSNLAPLIYDAFLTTKDGYLTTFRIQFTNGLSDTSTVNFTNLIVVSTNVGAGLVAYPTTVSDGLFYPRTSNPSNYVGASSPTLTGTLTLANVSSGTNTTLYTTNTSSITGTTDTNTIILTSAGLSAINGTYTFSLISGALTFYTNTAGIRMFYDLDAFEGDFWQITNGAGTELYGNTHADVTTSWTTRSGTAPAPVAVYGTNYTTNLYAELIAAGVRAPTVQLDASTIYVDSTIGDDQLWQRGHPDRPMKTLLGAIAIATNGNDVIKLSPGYFALGGTGNFTEVHLPDGLKILGAGKHVTIVTNTYHPALAMYSMGNNSVLSDLSLSNIVIGVGGYNITSTDAKTNVLLNSVDQTAWQDGLFLKHWRSVTAINCRFSTLADAFADYQTDLTANATNAFFDSYNCDYFVTAPPLSAQINGIVGASGRLRFFGGSITVVGSDIPSLVRGNAAAVNTNGSFELVGVGFSLTTTNGVGFEVKNDTGIPITLKGTPARLSKITGPVIVFGDFMDSLTIRTNLNVNGTITGNGSGLTAIPASQLTGALPAISGAALTGITATDATKAATNGPNIWSQTARQTGTTTPALIIKQTLSTATNALEIQDSSGNVLFAFGTNGEQRVRTNGAAASAGLAVMNGTTGVTVSTTRINTSSMVRLSLNQKGSGALGVPWEDKSNRVAGVSFILKSSNAADNGTVFWEIVEPAP